MSKCFAYVRKVGNLFLVLLFIGIQHETLAQSKPADNPYILFTGLVLTSDSLRPIPYVTISSNRRGIIGYTDFTGHFDIVVKKGDTVAFAQLEKVGSWHVVPDSLTSNRYYAVKLMTQDTMELPAIFIHAMPLKSLFDHTFLKPVPDDALSIAQRNLEEEALKENMKTKPADAKESQSLLAQTRSNQLYYYKQAPPQNYLSPIAWAQFLQAWKRGDFKKKKK